MAKHYCEPRTNNIVMCVCNYESIMNRCSQNEWPTYIYSRKERSRGTNQLKNYIHDVQNLAIATANASTVHSDEVKTVSLMVLDEAEKAQ